MKRTNIKICPSQSAIKKITDFCIEHSLPYDDFIKDPHCTIAISKDVLIPVSKIKLPDFKQVLVCNAGLKVFDTIDNGKTLVIFFDSDDLYLANEFYKQKYKLISRHSYIPHITLQKNITDKKLLSKIPLMPKLGFNFILNRIVMDNG
jgi:hypothetical protein